MQKSREESLCWECANACTNGCIWARKHVPVKGWVAERNDKYSSYHVKECPEFTREDVNRVRDYDDEGCVKLMKRVLEETRDDYIMCPRTREEIEKWIRSPKCRRVYGFDDPDLIIDNLRKSAIEYQKRRAMLIMR